MKKLGNVYIYLLSELMENAMLFIKKIFSSYKSCDNLHWMKKHWFYILYLNHAGWWHSLILFATIFK